jgi:protein-disulfide isomerase
LVLAIVVCAAGLPRAWAGECGDSSSVVAQVGDRKITLGELEKKEPAKILDAGYKYYMVQREVVQNTIDEELLEQQAKKENLTVDQLLNKHVRKEIKDPSDEALRVYYEGVDTDQPYEAIKDKIRDHIRSIRERKLAEKYIKSLRGENNVAMAIAPPKVDVALGNAPLQGPRDAAVKVVEFADYECPYCRKVEPTLEKLHKQFADRVAFAFKDYPLPMHTHAEKAAEAARCATAQGKFWDFHDKLFSADSLEVAQLKAYARGMNLDGAKFDKCLDSGGQAAGIEKDKTQGSKLGLTGTPSFFVNGHFVSGNVSYDVLEDLVRQQLTESSAGAHADSSSAKPAKEDKETSGGM